MKSATILVVWFLMLTIESFLSKTNLENLKFILNFVLIFSISSAVKPSGGTPVICYSIGYNMFDIFTIHVHSLNLLINEIVQQ